MVARARYFENGREVGRACLFCMFDLPEIVLADGVKVMNHDYRLEVIKPGQPNILLAEAPQPPPRKPDEPVLACAGPAFHLLGMLDNRYLLYRADGLPWIYGIAENRKALLTGSSIPVAIYW